MDFWRENTSDGENNKGKDPKVRVSLMSKEQTEEGWCSSEERAVEDKLRETRKPEHIGLGGSQEGTGFCVCCVSVLW